MLTIWMNRLGEWKQTPGKPSPNVLHSAQIILILDDLADPATIRCAKNSFGPAGTVTD